MFSFYLPYMSLKLPRMEVWVQGIRIENIYWANTFSSRVMGLMNMPPEDPIQGLLLDPCNSIHTFFMKFSLDCIFLDKHNQITQVLYDIPPYRMTRMYFRACKTLEIRSNIIPKNILHKNKEQIRIECIN